MRQLLMVVVTLLLTVTAARAQAPESEALPLLQQAMAAPKDQKLLEEVLAKVDAVVTKSPNDPYAHYSRGWLLSRLSRADESVKAYEKAFALDGKLADAVYNAGVVLAGAGKDKEAVTKFELALKSDPKHVDAAYNAGQAYYNQKKFTRAAEKWALAETLAPEDFQIAKKLVQAHVAAGNDAAATKAREKVFALWKSGKDPALSKQKSYVYDQLDVGKYHIYVHEAFDTGGDLALVYRFEVTLAEKPLGSVNLETSAVIREQGVPFVMGMYKGKVHTTLAKHSWKERPPYKEVKALAVKLIAENF